MVSRGFPKQCVVVFDEAHNIGDYVPLLYGPQVNRTQVFMILLT